MEQETLESLTLEESKYFSRVVLLKDGDHYKDTYYIAEAIRVYSYVLQETEYSGATILYC